MDKTLGTVTNDLGSIRSTIERLEARQIALENEVHNSSLSSSVPSTPTSTSSVNENVSPLLPYRYVV